MINFSVAVFLLIITPGPGVLTTAGIGAAYGWRAGLAFIAGLFVGTNLVALAVILGLDTFVATYPLVRICLVVLSTLFLFYLAAKIALAGSKLSFVESQSAPGFWTAVALQAVNPKAYVVNATMFLGFKFMPDSYAFELIAKFLIMNAIWIPIHFAWLFLGASIKEMNLSAKAQTRINWCMASALVGVVVLALLSLT